MLGEDVKSLYNRTTPFIEGRRFVVTKVPPLAPIDRGSGGCNPRFIWVGGGFISNNPVLPRGAALEQLPSPDKPRTK